MFSVPLETVWLAGGYAIHGLWDWIHDAGMVAANCMDKEVSMRLNNGDLFPSVSGPTVH